MKSVTFENYFKSEINQRKLCSKKLSKCVNTFDYINKILIVLSATTGGVCFVSHVTVVVNMVVKYGSEIWINQKHLEKNLILQILLTELSIILQNLKK